MPRNSDGKLPEVLDLVGELVEHATSCASSADPHRFERLRNPASDLVASGGRQRLQHAARRGPGRVDALAAQDFDDALPELPQPDAPARQVRIALGQAEDVALGRVRIEAQQQIGRGQVEEAQGVRLQDLRRSSSGGAAADGRRRDLDAEQRVARPWRWPARGSPGRCRRCAPSAPASRGTAGLRRTSRSRGTRPRGTAPNPPARVVQVDGDLGVAFDTGDWRDQNSVRHGLSELASVAARARVRPADP